MFADLELASHVVLVNPNNLPTYRKLDGRLHRLPVTFSGELLTFRGGMRDLITMASAALSNVTILSNSTATSITPQGSQWLIGMDGADTQVADAVILAIPAQAASALLADIIVSAASSLAALEYRPTTTVTMAWNAADVPHALDGTGYLIADDASPISACTWVSSKNPSHARPGIVLLRGYIRGTGGDPVSLMRAEVAAVLGITTPPVFTRTYEWHQGLPTYTPDHQASVHAVSEKLNDLHGIFIAGSAFHGVGIPDCIHSGERAAAAAASYLAALQSEEAA
jgi:oxygen-dependent protoporphyrinogen oxidase